VLRGDGAIRQVGGRQGPVGDAQGAQRLAGKRVIGGKDGGAACFASDCAARARR